MGYILPIIPYQYMQYTNRIQYREENLKDFGPVKETQPTFALALRARMESFALYQSERDTRNGDYSKYKELPLYDLKQKRVTLSHITGKGRVIDEYV